MEKGAYTAYFVKVVKACNVTVKYGPGCIDDLDVHLADEKMYIYI